MSVNDHYPNIKLRTEACNEMSGAGSILLVSAPGKVILHGEHAVVYGKQALASSVDLRCYTMIKINQSSIVTLDLPDLGLKRSWPLSDLMVTSTETEMRNLAGIREGFTPGTDAVACLAFLYLFTHICRDKLKSGLEVRVIATLPAGAGLGSSAAYSVSLAAALLTHVRSIQPPSLIDHTPSLADLPQSVQCKPSGSLCMWNEQDLNTINKWGFEAEKLIHGQPSGIDNSVSTLGGAISFKAGQINQLKSMPRLRVLLVNTQVPRSTKKLVSGVRERRDRFPAMVDHMLDAIESLVESAMETFADMESYDSHMIADAYKSLQELFTINHHLLNALGVGHSSLDRVCEIVAKYNLSAKLTGGGGGGCAIVLLPPDTDCGVVEECSHALEEAGYKCWSTEVGAVGVCLHHLDTS